MRVALVSGLILCAVVAGCGGSSSDKNANQAYADSVCTAVGTWKQEIESIATDFSGGISKASLEKKIGQAEAATKTLVTDIKAAPAPKTSQGQAARQQLTQLADDLQTTVDSAKTTVDQLQGDASVETITGAVSALGPQVQSLASETKSAIATLKDAGGDLASAFKRTDSCKTLT